MAKLDPILAEIRAIRDAHAKEFNYDIGAIVEDLRRQQEESGETYLPPPPRQAILPTPTPVQQPIDSPHQSH